MIKKPAIVVLCISICVVVNSALHAPFIVKDLSSSKLRKCI